MRAPLLALALVAAALPGAAQTFAPAGAFSVVGMRVRSELPTGTSQLTGPVFGGQGALEFGRVGLDASYVQGTVSPDGGGGAGFDLIEGRVRLAIRPLAWLTLSGGPHARSYALLGGTQRGVFWEVGARASSTFIGQAARGYVEFWRAVATSVNVPEPFDHAQGGEAGMLVHLADAPLEVRVAYRLDHAVLGGGSRRETVEGVVVSVGLARW
jgi:hypothetical protein